MDIHKLREVIRQAEHYKIKFTYKRDESDYTIIFSDDHQFADGHKAMKFIDKVVEENKLDPYTKPYRVGFGWEIY